MVDRYTHRCEKLNLIDALASQRFVYTCISVIYSWQDLSPVQQMHVHGGKKSIPKTVCFKAFI